MILAERFFAAMHNGDTDALASLLAEDVVLYADGGGKGPAIEQPIRGVIDGAVFLADLGSRRMLLEGISMVLADVNGQPGAVAQDSFARTVAAIFLDIADDHVYAMRAVTNPDKLVHVLD